MQSCKHLFIPMSGDFVTCFNCHKPKRNFVEVFSPCVFCGKKASLFDCCKCNDIIINLNI